MWLPLYAYINEKPVGKSEGMMLSLQQFKIYKEDLGEGACTGLMEPKSGTLQMALSNIHGCFLPCDVYMGFLWLGGGMHKQHWNYCVLNEEFQSSFNKCSIHL